MKSKIIALVSNNFSSSFGLVISDSVLQCLFLHNKTYVCVQ